MTYYARTRMLEGASDAAIIEEIIEQSRTMNGGPLPQAEVGELVAYARIFHETYPAREAEVVRTLARRERVRGWVTTIIVMLVVGWILSQVPAC